LSAQNPAGSLRLAQLARSMSSQLAGQDNVLVYAAGVESLALGDVKRASETFGILGSMSQSPTVKSIPLPAPSELAQLWRHELPELRATPQSTNKFTNHITLGTYDSNVQLSALEEYIEHAKKLTGVEKRENKLRGEKDDEWPEFRPLSGSAMTVADAQRFLKEAGIFPFGKIDGICGYRTVSAIRLFQEYVRSVEGEEGIGTPDGRMGPKTIAHADRWRAKNQKVEWNSMSADYPSREYAEWISLLRKIKEKYVAAPNAMLQKVNEDTQPSDTIKVANWDFDPNKIHLIGVRRNETYIEAGERRFDDAFVLLIRGMAFKFLGATDPGDTENPEGFPFLTQGQHLYRFGWYKIKDLNRVFHALKPLGRGVLVVRSKDTVLYGADLARKLEPNNTINIYWGGEGLFNVGKWSVGSQVIVGKGYINHNDAVVDCSEYAATKYDQLGTKNYNGVYQTKGAYNVLTDLVAALSGADQDDNVVRYMLIYERDLALSPEIGAGKANEIVTRLQALPV
jgi:peptidoglycan hydrolase-like protein with peptidoglycan-binding domain